MDFGKVLSRAWEITWRWKILWIFGFLASLSQGGGSPYTYSFGGDEFDFDRWGWGVSPAEFYELFAAISVLVITLMCLAIVVAIILWVITVIARGGLIAGVLQVEEDGSTSFRRAWAVGVRKFWTLFGLGVLSAIPMIILIIIGVIFLALGIGIGVGMLDVAEAAAITTIIFTSIVCGGFLCCGLFILVIILEQIRIYGERAAILEDLGWIDAFKRGWEVLKENLGATIIYWLIFFALGIVIFIIFGLIMVALAIPFLGLFAFDEPGLWWIGPICFGGLVGVIVFALIRSILTTFTSATWTLAYREMTATSEHPDLDNLELIGEA